MLVHAAGWALLFVVIAILLLAIIYQPTGRVGGYQPDCPPRKPPAPPTSSEVDWDRMLNGPDD